MLDATDRGISDNGDGLVLNLGGARVTLEDVDGVSEADFLL